MRHSVRGFLAAPLVATAMVQAQTLILQQPPTVVYEGRSTISAQPYYQRLQSKEPVTGATVTAPDGAGILALEDRLPLSPTQLQVGPPTMKTIPGLTTPLFIMGMDERSLNWFSRAAKGLSDISARGIVVQATQRSGWRDLHSRAREAGIALMLLDGDAIAQGYRINTYPTVLMSPELAQKGPYE